MGDEQFGGDVEDKYFVDLAESGEFVEQFADVGCARQYFLHHAAERLEHRVIQDGCEIYVDELAVHSLVRQLFLVLDHELILGVCCRQLHVRLVYEDEELAVVRVLLPHVLVDGHECLQGFKCVHLRIDNIDQRVCIL